MNEMYDLHQEDLLLVENKDMPLVLGSVTKNTAISMIDVSMFNLFLDEQKIKKDLGPQGERAMRTMLTVSQGVKGNFGKSLSNLAQVDWLQRFRENLPFPEEQMLVCNLPETKLSEKLDKGLTLTAQEAKQRKDEAQNDIFVFAGYVEPGKHQIIIKDQKENKWYAREIVVEARRKDIINCRKYQQIESLPELVALTMSFTHFRPSSA